MIRVFFRFQDGKEEVPYLYLDPDKCDIVGLPSSKMTLQSKGSDQEDVHKKLGGHNRGQDSEVSFFKQINIYLYLLLCLFGLSYLTGNQTQN